MLALLLLIETATAPPAPALGTLDIDSDDPGLLCGSDSAGIVGTPPLPAAGRGRGATSTGEATVVVGTDAASS